MKKVRRFTSFEEMKASEVKAEPHAIVVERHHAFERLMALLRSKVLRRRGKAR
jgi:hypothetical protein